MPLFNYRARAPHAIYLEEQEYHILASHISSFSNILPFENIHSD